jgi:triphosphatase
VLRGTDPMPVAGAIVMSAYWQEADKRRSALRAGDDPEAVHDVRVGVRRLRVVLALFAPWYPGREVRGFRGDLRRMGNRLGAVRDGEVLIANARAASGLLPEADLMGLLARWEAQHAAARVRLLDYLDSSSFRRFERLFQDFLRRNLADAESGVDDSAAGPSDLDQPAVDARLVRDVMPAEIWRRYGAVHAYDRFIDGASPRRLHRLRIAGKRLRYALEPFQRLLGAEGKSAVGSLKDLQDALGAIHDADVSIDLLESFQANDAGPSDRVEPYIEQQRAALTESRAGFQSRWSEIVGPGLREHIAASALRLAQS